MKQMNIREFFKRFPDDETCLNHIFECRFGQGHECPKCERATNWYRIKAERAYSCQHCGHHLHPTVGTPFEASRTPLQLWFYAIYLFTTTRHGVSAKELQRQLGVTYKCAWRMGHQIREHMEAVDGDEPLSGIVEADEAYIGGKSKGKRGRGASGKTVVFGMVERGGDVIVDVVPNAKTATIQPIILESVEKGSEMHTDEWFAYRGLDKKGYKHDTVEHGAGEYADGDTHVNTIEGYWSFLKNGIRSTHIHVSGKHLEKYAKEFEYRFNSRKNPTQMFPELISSYPEKDPQ
ncbi:MAG: IS1595 family transposase [Pseudomonadales bacterium]